MQPVALRADAPPGKCILSSSVARLLRLATWPASLASLSGSRDVEGVDRFQARVLHPKEDVHAALPHLRIVEANYM